jgi:hypothetical protein
VNSVCVSADGDFIYTADDFGLVNVFKFPNPQIE